MENQEETVQVYSRPGCIAINETKDTGTLVLTFKLNERFSGLTQQMIEDWFISDALNGLDLVSVAIDEATFNAYTQKTFEKAVIISD